MGTVETLTAWGILRAAEVVELAAAAGLDLGAACTMLEKESGGGRNVWGSDGVSTGGAYVKGAEVTQAAYQRYRALQDAGQIGAQGVGPTQLTYPPLQRQADQVGGCWEWRANVLTGFRHLASLHRAYGVREGFRRYNGSGPMAERYADDSMAKLAKWRTRIGTPTSSGPATGATPQEDDLQADEREALFKIRDWLGLMKPGVPLPGRSEHSRVRGADDQYGQVLNAEANAADALAEVRALRQDIAKLQTAAPQIDYAQLAAALIQAAVGR